jgi:hypothetical protein
MPATAAARLDDIQATLSTIRHEQTRLERLGFENPMFRCHAELRYWSFLEALHSLPADRGPDTLHGGPSWPAPSAR